MHRRGRLVFVLGTLLALTAATAARGGDDDTRSPQTEQPSGPRAFNTQSCFSSGSGAKLFRWCTSSEGNIVELTAPAGVEHINLGLVEEGYSICIGSDTIAGDLAMAGGTGFNAATRTQPGGPNTLPLTITRTTTNGWFRLSQSFARNNAEREIVITMTLKNLTNSQLANVGLFRTADFDVDGDNFDDQADAAHQSTWMRDSSPLQAPVLEGITFGNEHTAFIEEFGVNRATAGVSNCFTPAVPTPTPLGDWMSTVRYTWDTFAAGASKTVKYVYRVQ